MPRGKKGQYALASDGDGGLSPVVVDGSVVGVSGVPVVPEGSPRETEAGEAFIRIIARDDGWVRVAPGGDGKQNYWKYKFNRGPWSGHYVMYVGYALNWVDGILGLARKLDQVDAGTHRPAHDTFYDPR